MRHGLAPGFRFHPTDPELVGYYLKRKVFGKLLPRDTIADVDVYKFEPWDLPYKSLTKSRDLEWYFFSVLDRKYGNGSKTNRATEKGYWKTTGKDRTIRNGASVMGMKKTLVYHFGRAPHGDRTNWVMHEYKLVDEQLLHNPGENPVAYVVCRIFQKSGSGPRINEQRGAPFVEEEWEDDDDEVLALAPGQPAAVPVPVSVPVPQLPPPLGAVYFDPNEFFKDVNVDISEKAPLLNCDDHSNNAEILFQNEDNTSPGWGESHLRFKLPDERKFSGLHAVNIDAQGIGFENFMEDYVGLNPDEAYLDASNNPPLDGISFIETDDLSNFFCGEVSGPDMMDDCLAFFDAEDIGPQEDVKVQSEQESAVTQIIDATYKDSASSSKQGQEAEESDIHHLILKRATRMLGSIPAPHAFASELPSKETLLRLNTVAQSSSLVRASSEVAESGGPKMKWSCTENRKINCLLSLAFPAGDSSRADLHSVTGFFRLANIASAVSWRWFFSMFQCFSAPILPFVYKVGSLVSSR